MSGVAVSGLRVVLGKTTILSGVDLSAAKGEWVGLIGPNGAGKTTLLRAVHGAISSAGTVTVGDRDVSHLSPPARARMAALVPQRPTTPPDMRVFDYVLLGRNPHISYLGVEGRHDVTVARTSLASLSMEGLADRLLGELSGGELQQVVLARALTQEASLLLLDEPTSALDVGHQIQVLTLIDRLRRERSLTVLSAMHDLTLAAQFCDRLVLLSGGKVIADGTPREVLREAVITRHFAATVRILDDGTGGIVVVPVRSNGKAQDR